MKPKIMIIIAAVICLSLAFCGLARAFTAEEKGKCHAEYTKIIGDQCRAEWNLTGRDDASLTKVEKKNLGDCMSLKGAWVKLICAGFHPLDLQYLKYGNVTATKTDISSSLIGVRANNVGVPGMVPSIDYYLEAAYGDSEVNAAGTFDVTTLPVSGIGVARFKDKSVKGVLSPFNQLEPKFEVYPEEELGLYWLINGQPTSDILANYPAYVEVLAAVAGENPPTDIIKLKDGKPYVDYDRLAVYLATLPENTKNLLFDLATQIPAVLSPVLDTMVKGGIALSAECSGKSVLQNLQCEIKPYTKTSDLKLDLVHLISNATNWIMNMVDCKTGKFACFDMNVDAISFNFLRGDKAAIVALKLTGAGDPDQPKILTANVKTAKKVFSASFELFKDGIMDVAKLVVEKDTAGCAVSKYDVVGSCSRTYWKDHQDNVIKDPIFNFIGFAQFLSQIVVGLTDVNVDFTACVAGGGSVIVPDLYTALSGDVNPVPVPVPEKEPDIDANCAYGAMKDLTELQFNEVYDVAANATTILNHMIDKHLNHMEWSEINENGGRTVRPAKAPEVKEVAAQELAYRITGQKKAQLPTCTTWDFFDSMGNILFMQSLKDASQTQCLMDGIVDSIAGGSGSSNQPGQIGISAIAPNSAKCVMPAQYTEPIYKIGDQITCAPKCTAYNCIAYQPDPVDPNVNSLCIYQSNCGLYDKCDCGGGCMEWLALGCDPGANMGILPECSEPPWSNDYIPGQTRICEK